MSQMLKLFFFALLLIFNGAYASLLVDSHKRVLIVCDMWEDSRMSAGGTEMVVCQVRDGLRKRGYEVNLMGFADVKTFDFSLFSAECYSPLPFFVTGAIKEKIQTFNPDYIFITRSGVLSSAAINYCASMRIPCTAFHSVLGAEFMKAATGFPMWLSRYFLNSFLAKATNIVVPTESVRTDLVAEGFNNVIAWPHGVDLERFKPPSPEGKAAAVKACGLEEYARPYHLFVGRLSEEKNFATFLKANVAGTKIAVGREGRGFSLDQLRKDYPDVVFAGKQMGQDLVKYYQAADIFLFPSKLDTFGLVMLEALACGVPVVGFNTYGPRDVVPHGCGVSYLADNLDDIAELEACASRAWADLQSQVVTPEQCRAYASKFSWHSAIDQLEQVIVKTQLSNDL